MLLGLSGTFAAVVDNEEFRLIAKGNTAPEVSRHQQLRMHVYKFFSTITEDLWLALLGVGTLVGVCHYVLDGDPHVAWYDRGKLPTKTRMRLVWHHTK